jgi:hypothetical protein
VNRVQPRWNRGTVVVIGMVLAVVLAGIVALFASTSPDGLERVAEDVGFADTATDSAVADSPLADYVVGGEDTDGATWRSVLAGIAGVLIMTGVAFGGFWALTRRRREVQSPAHSNR